MRGQRLFFVAALAVGALVGAPGCGNDGVPPFPTYENDIRPLMAANCVRCHGAGGTLNLDPDVTTKINSSFVPTNGDFTRLDDANGRNGLLHYTAAGPGLAAMNLFLPQMPPPPADPLSGWYKDLLETWVNNPIH
jgi:hypothetical protein